MRTFRRACCLLAAGCLLAGCAPSGSPLSRSREWGESGRAEVGFDVGCLAPEIEGEDADGRRFKLSDYRGKVVLLEFWGST